VGETAREDRADNAGEPAILAFEADDPVRVELPVRASLKAAEHAAVAVVAGGEPVDNVIAGERAADMGADIEAGPAVNRRSIGGRIRIGRGRVGRGRAVDEVGGGSRELCTEGCDRCGDKQQLLHWSYSNKRETAPCGADRPYLNNKLSPAGHGDLQSNMLEAKGFLVPNGTLRKA